METMIARCCGLDVHKASVRACVRLLVDGVVRELIETSGPQPPICWRCATGWRRTA